jgi:DGQHR domain-containing protein
MEGVIKGVIKRMTPTFGVVTDQSTKEDYIFFLRGNNTNDKSAFNVGDIVSYELKTNSRNSYDAHNISLIEGVRANKKKSKFFFTDKNDAIFGFKFIKDKLDDQLSKSNNGKDFEDPDYITTEINEIIEIVDDLLNGPSPNINDINIEDINNFNEPKDIGRNDPSYWQYNFNIEEFAQRVIEVGNEVAKGKTHDFTFTWHQWQDNEKQIFSAGYTQGYFNYSFVDKGQKEQTHVYDHTPPETKWRMIRIEQKGNIFYLGSAPVNEIAQSSYVPSLPPQMQIEETAGRIIDSAKKPNEWQREVDVNRVRKIQQFIEESDNIIANTPMVFVNDSDAVEIKGNELRIDYSKFLKPQNDGEFAGQFIDRKKRAERDEAGNIVFDDYRPLWLIDGQHRIKGIHRSKEQCINVPIIIFPNDFGAKSTAKVFAEINTLQKKLNPLHELFMQHRFSIDHINPKRKFRDYESESYIDAENNNWSKDWEHSRANHLSYEIAALLAMRGVLKSRIQFLTQNTNKNILISADQWVNYSRDWFYSKCYKYKGPDIQYYIKTPVIGDLNLSQREVFHFEIGNYFKAWVETCNHDEWKDIGHKKKWIDGSMGKALIQKKSHFIILLELFHMVREKAIDYMIEHEIKGRVKKEYFLEILKVFKWVDWADKNLQNTYGGGGEKGRRSLEAWMADAILSGQQQVYEEIHQENPEENKSEAGKGICSYLDTPTIEIKSDNSWPGKDNPVVLESLRPINARSESSWSIFDNNENLINEGKSSVSKHIGPMHASFKLKYSKEMRFLSEMIVQVEWKNAHTRTGKSKFTLRKN